MEVCGGMLEKRKYAVWNQFIQSVHIYFLLLDIFPRFGRLASLEIWLKISTRSWHVCTVYTLTPGVGWLKDIKLR